MSAEKEGCLFAGCSACWFSVGQPCVVGLLFPWIMPWGLGSLSCSTAVCPWQPQDKKAAVLRSVGPWSFGIADGTVFSCGGCLALPVGMHLWIWPYIYTMKAKAVLLWYCSISVPDSNRRGFSVAVINPPLQVAVARLMEEFLHWPNHIYTRVRLA